MKFGFKWPSVFFRERTLKMNLSDFGLRSMDDLTCGCHKSSCTHLFDFMYQLPPHRLQ